MQLQYRFATPADIPRILPLLLQDRVLFHSETWAKVPALLADLIERRVVLPGVIEDTETGRPVFFGATAWTRPSSVASLLSQGPGLFRDAILRSEAKGKRILLSQRELRIANTSGDLALVHLAGCPESADFTQARAEEVHRLANQFFVQVHSGYRIAQFWQENHAPEAAIFLAAVGMTKTWEVPVKSGFATLYRFTRDEAMVAPNSPLAYLMRYPEPRLGFSPAQQRLLELALLDHSDATAAEQLGISVEAVRKRWRAIHSRHTFGTGKDQRRPLLGYLRLHPEELRPWGAR